MTKPFARVSGNGPASPPGAQKHPEARKGGERANGQARITPDDENLAGNQLRAESEARIPSEIALFRMNETLRRLHKTAPTPHKGHKKTAKTQ